MLALKIFVYTELLIIHGASLVLSGNELAGTSVEAENIINELPHSRIEQPPRLAKHSEQVVSCPFEETLVPRDGEGHLGRVDLDALASQETQEVGVGAGVEHNLSGRQVSGRIIFRGPTYKST
jgi:hypothetical protein